MSAKILAGIEIPLAATSAEALKASKEFASAFADSRLPRTCTNDTVVCIATGPSLTAADVEYCRGKASVIVVNDAHRLCTWATALYSSDRYWWRHYGGVPEFAGLKVAIEHTPRRKDPALARLVPEMIWMKHTGFDGVETSRDGLRTCANNSGGAAVNLALHLGAKRIILLGYDMGVTGSKRHFFGEHPQGLSKNHNFPGWRAAFERMRAPFEALGVTVLNCSRSTSLNAFPVVPLEDVL